MAQLATIRPVLVEVSTPSCIDDAAQRHTAASLAISAGANPKVVQRMLEHASAAMTLDAYADLFESDLDEVAVTVAKMWPREPETNARSAPKTL